MAEQDKLVSFEMAKAMYDKVDGDVSGLKSAIGTLQTDLTILALENWTQGGVNSANGGTSTSTTVCRKPAGLVTDDMETIVFGGNQRGYNISIWCYTSSGYTTASYDKDACSGWINGDAVGYRLSLKPYLGYYIRVCVSWGGDTITPSDVVDVRIVKTEYTDTTLSKSGKAADAKVTGDAFGNMDDLIGPVVSASFTKPASGNATYNLPFKLTAGQPITLWWERANTPVSGTPSANFTTRATASGETVETLATSVSPGVIKTVTPTEDAAYLRISATGDGVMYVGNTDGLEIRVKQLEISGDKNAEALRREPLTRFDFNHTLYDTRGITDAFGLTTETRDQMMDKVYAFFSGLANDYPGYVTEILDATTGADGQTPTGLSYPWYAADGVAAGSTHTIPIAVDSTGAVTESVSYTYTKTVSPYNVRLYRLSDTNPALPASGKKKILITGGTHGNEVVAPIDLCVLAKRLCEPTDDPDMLKLRATFDFYIVPILDGFGAQYLSRTNGNLVDINRNYPTSAWAKTTADFSNLATCTFSGPSAGSEFETQLVMALANQIKPNIYLDHHNSGTGASQFYSIVTNAVVGNAIYEALTDCAYTFIHGLPDYFGTNYNLFSSGDVSPGTFTAANGHSGRWMYEQGIIPSGTCEVFEAINFTNGVRNANPTKYTADTFKVAEYTLRNVILHLCQFALEH